MATKILNKERSIPTTQVPSVSREEAVLEVASFRRNILVLDTIQQLPFMILDETSVFSKN